MSATTSKAPTHASNVYLFKNGYGMIVKTFEFPPTQEAKTESLELIDLPTNAVHGTFWVQSVSNNISVKSIRTKKTRKLVDQECLTLPDLIEANMGENVQLLTTEPGSNTKEWIGGTLKSVKRHEAMSDDDTSADASSLVAHPLQPTSVFHTPPIPISSHSTPVQHGDLVILQNNEEISAISLSSVRSIRGGNLKTSYQKKVFTNGLLINYQSTSKSNEMGLMKYLTFGLTWVPSYSLVILPSTESSGKRLRLSSKAVILNDIENMHVDNLFCIVGFPNVSKFASVRDPIIDGNDVRTFLDQLKQAETSGNAAAFGGASLMSNSVMMQQVMRPPMVPSTDISDASQVDNDGDDLHLYEFKNVLLQKKERLIVPIFDIELPYKDVYHCEIKGVGNDIYYGQYREPKDFEEVWHSVQFENQSKFVWTTAPVVVTRGLEEQQFIGQDKITYTLQGASTFVDLTKALDVRIRSEERVTNTNANRFRIHRVEYQTEQIEGKIQLANCKSEDVLVALKVALVGKISNYSAPPKHDTIAVKVDVANEHHNVHWEVALKPKQSVEIKYIRLCNKRV